MGERIDSHCHVWIPENKAYPYNAGVTKVNLHEGSVEILLETMEKNGISKAVLVQPGHYGSDNSYMMDCCERYPGRFAAVIRVDPFSPDALSDLDFWAKQRGAQGLRHLLGGFTPGNWDKGKSLYPFWEKIRELGIVVGFMAQPHQAAMVKDLLRLFPEVPVIIDHLGLPSKDESPEYPSFEKILELAEFPQVYIKMSGLPVFSKEKYPHQDMIGCAERAVNAFGSERVVWATDFCFTVGAHNYHEGIEIVEDHMPFLNEEDKDWIFFKTILKLFSFNN